MLPLVIERATRLAQFYTRSDKIYEGVVRFGWSTDHLRPRRRAHQREARAAGSIRPRNSKRALERFRGEFLQTPPPVSAKKVDGQRAYELAREADRGGAGAGARCRSTSSRCSKSTAPLRGCGRIARAAPTCAPSRTIWAKRSAAARTWRTCAALASGEFEIAQARTIAQLESLAAEERLIDALVPAAQMLPGFPAVFVDDLTAARSATAAISLRPPSARSRPRATSRPSPAAAIWWPSAKPCCRTSTIRWWCCDRRARATC